MSSPGLAILWQITWRFRWLLLASAIYLLVASALSHLLPIHWLHLPGPRGEETPAVGYFLGVFSIFINILLTAVFGMTGHDSSDSGFSRHMFVLPVRTRTLVAWPMLGGCLAVAAVWLIVAGLIFRPGGIAAPLWGPAAAMAVCLAAFQAVSWTPFAQRWLQLALIVAVLAALFCLLPIYILLNIHLSEPVIALGLVALIPFAYMAALSGVARARRGDAYDWRAWSRAMEWIAARRSPVRHPFSSARAAQLWFECRAHAWIVPVFVGSMLFCFGFVPFIEPGDVTFGWKIAAILIGGTLLIAMMTGGALGNLHDPFSKVETAAFVLTRPVSSLSLVRGKLAAAAVATALTWLLEFAVLALLLLRPGFAASVGEVVRPLPAWKAISVPILLLSVLMLLTWKNMVENLWVALTGRAWIGHAFGIGNMVLLFCGTGVGLWIYFHPDLHAAALSAVPPLIGLALVVKLTAAALVLVGLVRFGLTGPKGIALFIAGWGMVVVGLSALALLALPAPYAATRSIVPAVVLLVPFARLAGAPLALDWNRHR